MLLQQEVEFHLCEVEPFRHVFPFAYSNIRHVEEGGINADISLTTRMVLIAQRTQTRTRTRWIGCRGGL